MTTCLGKSFSFNLPCLVFVNVYQLTCVLLSPFGFEGEMWDLIVLVPDYCLSFSCHTVHVYLIFRRAVIGVGVEEEDQKHTWMEDAESVSSQFIIPYSFWYNTSFVSLPKQSQKSRSILQDESRF